MRGRKRGRGDERREEREVQRVGEEGGTGKKKRTTGGGDRIFPFAGTRKLQDTPKGENSLGEHGDVRRHCCLQRRTRGAGKSAAVERRRMPERQLARHEDITREDHKKKAKEKAAESSNGGTSLDNAGTFMGAVVRGG